MKQNAMIFALMASALLAAPDAFGQSVQWPIEAVTVYERGAKIERAGTVALDGQGEATVTLTGLSASVVAEMLQVSLGAGWSLASHQFTTAAPSEQLNVARQNQADIDREIESNRQTYSLREALLFAYEEELAMIRSNRSVNGEELLLVDDLRDHANFWRERVKELSYLMLELRMEMEQLTADLSVLEAERQEWEDSVKTYEGQWTLRFAGPPNSRSDIRVSYVVSDAGWTPVYDAEVSMIGDIQMKRYASVYQSTGHSWEEVPLVFVVGNPLQSIAPPTVDKKELRLGNNNAANSYAWEAQASFDDYEGFDDLRSDDSAAPTAIERYEFAPAVPVVIRGDGSPERIFIETFDLAGDLSYLLLPEYTDEAYQLVNSGEWSASRLVPGRVQVIAGGMYRGAYFMQLPAPGDTLHIPLGQDLRVRANRERVLDRCTSSVFGGSRKTTQSFEITVENQHNRTVTVAIQDAIPVAVGSDIQVEVMGLSDGELDSVSGQVVWDLELGPNERKTLSFGYVVTYPKRRSLEGL
ncbi:MAG: mucoidy inhibitor MuiA family protein [Flavobacteriales bacterium]